MLKLYPHLISHFHTFHFQQAAKLSKMSVRRDEISSMKRKNTINGQRVGCFGVDKPLVCLYLHLYLQLQFHIPLSLLPLYLALPQFDSWLCRRFTFKWTRGSFFFPLLLCSLSLQLIENFPLHWTWKWCQFPRWHWAKYLAKFPLIFHSNFVINLRPWVPTNFVWNRLSAHFGSTKTKTRISLL